MIDFFKSLDLHDTPLKAIELKFFDSLVDMTILHHDLGINDYFEIQMNFSEVSNFRFGSLDRIAESEITSFKVSEVDNKYHVEFELLCDQPFYPVELEFQFAEVAINYPQGFAPHFKK